MKNFYKKIKFKNMFFYFKKNSDKFFNFLTVLFFMPVLIFIRLKRNLLLFRFVYFPSERFGNFVLTPEFYFCELNSGYIKPNKKYIDLFYFGKYCSNEYFKKIVKNRLNFVIPYKFGVNFYKICSKLSWNEHIDLGKSGYYSNIDLLGVLEKNDIQIKLYEGEKLKGKKILQKYFGIKENDKYICLNVRDNVYDSSKEDNFRNSSLETFESIILEFVDLGYFVIRMGRKVNSKLKINHPRVIDYATNGLWSEFLDIYIASTCYFAISTGTGWDSLPMMFRRPIVYVNLAQPAYITSFYRQSITLFKNFYCLKRKRYLNLSEICNSVIFQAVNVDTFTNNNIICKENSAKEILEACNDMLHYLEGKIFTSDEEELIKKFWSIYPVNDVSKYTGVPMHGKICGMYSISFLKNNPDWIK